MRRRRLRLPGEVCELQHRKNKTRAGFVIVEQPTQKRENIPTVRKSLTVGNLSVVTMDFIADFEGFRKCAYWDVKQWSVGYGGKSYKGECITKQEAKNRKLGYIGGIFELYPDNCFTDNQKIALTSYIYNTGGFQLNLRTHIKNCDKESILYVMNNWGWNLPGLVKRRNIEINLFKN